MHLHDLDCFYPLCGFRWYSVSGVHMCIEDEDDSLEEIEELYTIIVEINTDDGEEEESQYEDLDDEEFDIDF